MYVCCLQNKEFNLFRQEEKKQNKAVLKPKLIVDYNPAKMDIVISDQISLYSTDVKKSMY